jgi:hypothetical protein
MCLPVHGGDFSFALSIVTRFIFWVSLLSGKLSEAGINGRPTTTIFKFACGTYDVVRHDVCTIGHVASGGAGAFARSGRVAVVVSAYNQRAKLVGMFAFAAQAAFPLHIAATVTAVAGPQGIDVPACCVSRCAFAAKKTAVRHRDSC